MSYQWAMFRRREPRACRPFPARRGADAQRQAIRGLPRRSAPAARTPAPRRSRGPRFPPPCGAGRGPQCRSTRLGSAVFGPAGDAGYRSAWPARPGPLLAVLTVLAVLMVPPVPVVPAYLPHPYTRCPPGRRPVAVRAPGTRPRRPAGTVVGPLVAVDLRCPRAWRHRTPGRRPRPEARAAQLTCGNEREIPQGGWPLPDGVHSSGDTSVTTRGSG